MILPSSFSEKNTIRIFSRDKESKVRQLYEDLKQIYKK